MGAKANLDLCNLFFLVKKKDAVAKTISDATFPQFTKAKARKVQDGTCSSATA